VKNLSAEVEGFGRVAADVDEIIGDVDQGVTVRVLPRSGGPLGVLRRIAQNYNKPLVASA
jgi:hypothetical protein